MKMFIELECIPKEKKLILLGISETKEQAIKDARKRAKGSFFRVFDLSEEPGQVYQRMITWLRQIGIKEYSEALEMSKMVFVTVADLIRNPNSGKQL